MVQYKINNVFAISFCLIFLSVGYYLFYLGQAKRKNYAFEGRIQNIYYDKKMIPTLIVSGKSYYLTPLRNFQTDVEIGDLAIKKRGDKVLRIIKPSDGKVLEYNL